MRARFLDWFPEPITHMSLPPAAGGKWLARGGSWYEKGMPSLEIETRALAEVLEFVSGLLA